MGLDNIKWQNAKDKIIGINKAKQQIGTLSEKTVHAIVKNYYEPNEEYQEIWIDGKCADIFNAEGKIIEIQTASYSSLKPKLDIFLSKYDVTIVLPMPDYKQIVWIDPDTGEVNKPGPNRKYGNVYNAFKELYSIRAYLNNPNIHIKILMMNVIEYKLLSGKSRDRKKYGAKRYDRIPLDLTNEIILNQVKDYMQFVPEGLPENFTSTDFRKLAGISTRLTGFVIGLLNYIGIITRQEEKRGNAFIYRINEIY